MAFIRFIFGIFGVLSESRGRVYPILVFHFYKKQSPPRGGEVVLSICAFIRREHAVESNEDHHIR